jgi:hypothetical protein
MTDDWFDGVSPKHSPQKHRVPHPSDKFSLINENCPRAGRVTGYYGPLVLPTHDNRVKKCFSQDKKNKSNSVCGDSMQHASFLIR